MINLSDSYTQRPCSWTDFKALQATKDFALQFQQGTDRYEVWGYDGPEAFTTQIWIGDVPADAVAAGYSQEQNDADKADFEANFKAKGNGQIRTGKVVTQFERTDIDLKLAKSKCTVADGAGIIYVKAPSERFAGGGYLMLDSFDPEDYVKLNIEDKDRVIAMGVALAMNPDATEPVSDDTIRVMGVLPAPFGQAFPLYPIIKSYTDDEQATEDLKGWFFWPVALGGTKEAFGEVEIDPIGFYGELPGLMYVRIDVIRPNVPTGVARCCIFWGKSES